MAGFSERIEGYEILEQLGKGGFATVYRAICLRSRQELAIKMIDKKTMNLHQMTDRVRQEVAIHSRLKHPSILELFTFFEDSNYVYLILELAHNGELHRHLKANQKVMSEPDAALIVQQILSGLLYLHSHNICHRDMSLSNLLLTRHGTVKICDFGLATQLGLPDAATHLTLCGTPNYIAPEVAARSPHGLPIDVWGLGCTLYTLLVGRPPFDQRGVKSTLTQVVIGAYDMPENISHEAQDLICRCLCKDPSKRITIGEIAGHPFMRMGEDSGVVTSRLLRSQSEHGSLLQRFTSLDLTPKPISVFGKSMHSGSADPGGGVFHHTQENLDIPPLSTLRLQPTRHKTKNAILSILQSGEVVLEFVKLNHRFHEERVVDVCRISADGLRIVLYHPETGQIVGTEPPALPTNGADHLFSHDNLPAKHWKKYLYAARFIEMVKAKTPKVTFYSSKAKSQLMESGRDFEANFYDGCKIVKSKDSQILTDSSGAEVNLHYDQLPNHLKNIWSHAEQCLDHCQKLERINESQEMTLPCFPLIVGRRPPNSSNTSSPVLRSTENTFNNYLSSSQTPVRPPVIQMPSYSDLKDTFPGSLKNLQNLQRPLSNFTRNIYIPAIGFAAHLPDGLVQIQYIEGSQMTILPDGILFNSAPNQPTIHYKETDVMPESVRVKFQQIPSILKELMGGREKEVVTSTPCGRGRRYIR